MAQQQKYLNSWIDDDDDEEEDFNPKASFFGAEDNFVKQYKKPDNAWNLKRFKKPQSFKGFSSLRESTLEDQEGGKKRKRSSKKKSTRSKSKSKSKGRKRSSSKGRKRSSKGKKKSRKSKH